MILLGVWACQWRELKPISFGGKNKTTGDSAAVEEGAGFPLDNSAGSGRDGAGVYEMIGMPSTSRDGAS